MLAHVIHLSRSSTQEPAATSDDVIKRSTYEPDQPAIPDSTVSMAKQSTSQPPTQDTAQNTHSTNPLVMLLSYQPPTVVVSLKMTIVTLLAVVLPLHNHRHLFGAREVSLVTAFLGLEGQYVLAAYSLGWLASCTTSSQDNSHSGLVSSIAYFLHLPIVLVAMCYCVCTLVMHIVLDFLWYLFVVVCVLSVSTL